MIITRYARCRAIEVAFSDAKTCPACIDMIVRLRRVLIGVQFRRDVPRQCPRRNPRHTAGLGRGSRPTAKVKFKNPRATFE
jgi:hypothetical protein